MILLVQIRIQNDFFSIKMNVPGVTPLTFPFERLIFFILNFKAVDIQFADVLLQHGLVDISTQFQVYTVPYDVNTWKVKP